MLFFNNLLALKTAHFNFWDGLYNDSLIVDIPVTMQAETSQCCLVEMLKKSPSYLYEHAQDMLCGYLCTVAIVFFTVRSLLSDAISLFFSDVGTPGSTKFSPKCDGILQPSSTEKISSATEI